MTFFKEGNGQSKRFRRLLKASAILISILFIVIASYNASAVSAQPVYQYQFNISGYNVPTLDPSSTGNMVIELFNNLNVTATSIKLTADVYAYVNLANAVSYNLAASDTIPLINGTNPSVIYLPYLQANSSVNITLPVTASSTVSSGSYLVKFMMNAVIGSKNLTFKSKGYFPSSLWNRATAGTGFNYTLLNVSGILPETSITIKNPSVPLFLWTILALAVIFFFTGLFFYVRSVRNNSSDHGKKNRKRLRRDSQ